jgi:hypothetical protein
MYPAIFQPPVPCPGNAVVLPPRDRPPQASPAPSSRASRLQRRASLHPGQRALVPRAGSAPPRRPLLGARLRPRHGIDSCIWVVRAPKASSK